MDYARFCDVSRRLALEAGAAIMEVYHAADFDVRSKSDASPVTQADETADRLIAAGLRAAFPDIPVITEEEAESHAQEAAERFILVDPLDGTKEFVNRRGDFTVNIALIEAGLPVRGVVFAPARSRLFWTDEHGASFEEHGTLLPGKISEASPLRVAKPDNDALRIVASKSHRDAATDAYIEQYRVADFVAAGSSLKFCLLATGEADLYPRLGRTMEWDTAAGHAILRGAGGHVVRFNGHAPLGYGKPDWENPFFVAHAPGVVLIKG
ncbi:MAG: 3'(2'),5'-bisphosphate nucleotidase CysQ [Pseudomonadota bacterium]